MTLTKTILAATVALALPLAALAQDSASSGENPFRLLKGNQYGIVSIPGMVDTLPETSKNVIEDQTVLHRPGGGVRVFRLYGAVPQHYHMRSDAILYILKGRGMFKIEDEDPVEAGPGDMLFWAAGTQHGNPEVIEGPIDVLVFDLPTRDPSDTIWANPREAPSFLE